MGPLALYLNLTHSKTKRALFLNTKMQIGAIVKGGADWGAYAQVFFGVMLIVLALVLAVEGFVTLVKKKQPQA